jgi:tetratricopeptide (TPR) repeat protein
MNTPGRPETVQKDFPLWVWCLFLLALWQILLWAQNPGLMSDDSGEMIAASYRLGIPHPPGYPLFCLLGRLFSFVPVGTVAFRFNLLSSLLVLSSIFFLGKTCFSFAEITNKELFPPWLGLTAGFLSLFLFFSCRSVFAQALTAKGCVYTLTLLFLSVLLWLRVRGNERGPARLPVFFVLFLWALGLSNHWESEALWIPFLIYWFYQEKTRWNMKRIFQSLSLMAVGLSLYLYLPLRSALGALPSWGDPKTFGGFIWGVTRESYRGLEPLFRNTAFYLSFIKEYLHILSVYWMPGFAVLALVGLFYLWRHARNLFYSTLLFYLPVVAAILAVPREETKFLLTVYLLSSQGLAAFWGFVGILFLVRGLFKLGSQWPICVMALLFAAGLFWEGNVFKKEDKSQYYLASDFSINALKTLPTKSIFLAEGDNYVVPLFYQRFVLGLRPDIVFIPSIFLFHDWGWSQLAAQDPPVAAAVKSSHSLDGRLGALARLGDTRGFFYTLDQAYLGSQLNQMNGGTWTPMALEERWGSARIAPKLISQMVLNLAAQERLRGLTADYDPEDVTTFEIHHYYANQYFSAGRWLRGKGDFQDALLQMDKGLHFYPRAAYAYADMAAILGGEGYLELARRLSLAGIEADPGYFPNYANLGNVYLIEGNVSGARECYQSALGRVRDPEPVKLKLKALENVAEDKKHPGARDKSPSEYRTLDEGFKKQGMILLSDLTSGIVMESGR